MKIRRVLLDAFGTVFSPTQPVYTQYAEVARSFGLDVTDSQVRAGFKRAFKKWAQTHPLYGKHSVPPLEPRWWWKGVIGDTFRFAGVSHLEVTKVENELSDSLIDRFAGPGYTLHSEVPNFLQSLSLLDIPPPSIVSNTDPILSTIFDHLGVSERTLGSSGIKSQEIYTTWHFEKEKQDVRYWQDVFTRLEQGQSESDSEALKPEQVLVVGDELQADYETPRKAGFQSLLLRRRAPETAAGEGRRQVDHANPTYVDEVEGTHNEIDTVQDLIEVLTWIETRNS
ncbi:Dpi35p [Sporobolomyces koalae]|uniref:Dpi35p n=1 Tax=Sporobolomyces koalae TaxID=500713 RepID=UPI003179584A